MANQWFKFYGGEYLADPKIGRLTAAERSCWITILAMASMTDDGIIEYLEVDDLLQKSGVHFDPYNEGDWEYCQNILQKLQGMKMININTEKSEIIIINWKKRQETVMTGYERVKKYREKAKKEANDNEMITDDNANDNARIDKNRIDKNSISIAAKAADRKDESMNLQEFINWCKKSPQRHIVLIGEYADTIRPDFTTKLQWQGFMKRNLRAAKELTPHTDDQIAKAMQNIQKAQGEGWLKKYTLETLVKFL